MTNSTLQQQQPAQAANSLSDAASGTSKNPSYRSTETMIEEAWNRLSQGSFLAYKGAMVETAANGLVGVLHVLRMNSVDRDALECGNREVTGTLPPHVVENLERAAMVLAETAAIGMNELVDELSNYELIPSRNRP